MRPKLSAAQKRSLVQASLVLCLALISAAYVRLFNPEAFTDAYSPAKRPLPVYSVDVGEEKRVAISFDAAWGEEKTDAILKILEDRNIKTTFFLVGYWVDRYPDRVQQIFDAGHEIGNHSTTHPHMSKLSESQMIEELKGVSAKVKAVTGVAPTLFRPPYGDYNDKLVLVSRAQGYEIVQWDCDSLDWKNLGIQPMVSQVMNNAKPGSIILFHNNSQYITEALPLILDQLLAKGYEIVPVSEILLQGDYIIDNTGKQFAAAQGEA
ncbi:MAG: polysaccharide deacetylase family protein [Christensenellaceae bacterium]|jgi:polysaccharide deacetylase family sporulation protein PdaB|nr:polysaccharide deacetylase family protein [Christensenellaceae bacterium]